MEDRRQTGRSLARGGHYGVRARIRPLREGEAPASGAVDERRMVEYFEEEDNTAAPDQIGLSLYHPLQERDLLPTVLHLFGREQPPSDEEVVAFYGRYGPVAGAESVDGALLPAWAARVAPVRREQLPVEVIRFACEPLWWVREQAREVRLTYYLYLGLRDNDLPSLRRLLGGVPAGRRIDEIYLLHGQLFRDVVDLQPATHAEGDARSAPEPTELAPMSGKQCRLWAATLVARQLTDAERRVVRGWEMTWSVDPSPATSDPDAGGEDLEVTRVVRCHDLMAAVYLHLGELVQAGAALRQCPGCGKLFYSGRADKRYCSPTCGDATRQRTYYRRPGRTRRSAGG
jgi:hypothetical protein